MLGCYSRIIVNIKNIEVMVSNKFYCVVFIINLIHIMNNSPNKNPEIINTNK
jgi:hypothetical protein